MSSCVRYAARMYRYKVSYDHSGSYWHIYDRELPAECGLGGTPLRWHVNSRNVHAADSANAQESALNWLHHCYTTWGGVPLVGGDMIKWGKRRPFKRVALDAFGNVIGS